MTKLLTFDELRDHGVLYTRRWIHQLEMEGKFPKRVEIGARRIGWVESEIDAFVDQKINARTLGGSKKKRGEDDPPRSVSS